MRLGGFTTQTDPIGIAGGLNLYGYANGDPINFSDPFGLDPCEDFIDDEEKYAECEEGAKPFKQLGRDVADAAVNPEDAAAGFGDLLTLGGTKYVREQLLDCADCVDYDSGAYRAGQVAGATAVVVEGGLLAARLAGWTSKVAIHGAHHTFGSLGRLSHIQVNIWQKGVKGSGRALLRIPLPWR